MSLALRGESLREDEEAHFKTIEACVAMLPRLHPKRPYMFSDGTRHAP